MEEPFRILLTTSVLVLLSILASKVLGPLRRARGGGVSLPALGMLAWVGTVWEASTSTMPCGETSWGPQRWRSIALLGGLDTNWRGLRPLLGRGLALSTVGVAITALLVGAFHLESFLGFPSLKGCCWDRSSHPPTRRRVRWCFVPAARGLRGELKPLLEFESGRQRSHGAVFMIPRRARIFCSTAVFPGSSPAGAFVLNMAEGVLIGNCSRSPVRRGMGFQQDTPRL
jgi:cell volume regulation protein A